jgi:hypothetical protein
MNLPNEIVEHIIDFFIAYRRDPFCLYKENIAMTALISPYFLERVRKIRFETMHISTKMKPLPCITLSRYIKFLSLPEDTESCLAFNRVMAGCSLYLDSFEFVGKIRRSGLSILDRSSFKEIKSLVINPKEIAQFVQLFSSTLLHSVVELRMLYIKHGELVIVPLILNKLSSVTKLFIACFDHYSSISAPMLALYARDSINAPISTFDYCKTTLKFVRLNMRVCSDLHGFISNMINLEELHVHCYSINCESIIAWLRETKDLVKIRKVIFEQIGSYRLFKMIEFRFEDQKIISVDSLMYKHCDIGDHLNIDHFIRYLKDRQGYCAVTDFNKKVLGVDGNVKISFESTIGERIENHLVTDSLAPLLTCDFCTVA